MKNKKNKRIGTPHKIIYPLAVFFFRIYYILIKGVKMDVDKSGLEGIKGPALVLCPHVSNIDHVIVGHTLYPIRPTFVLSEHFITTPIMRFALLKLLRAITKKMFCADVSTILNIIRAKNEGNVIVMFPEGRLNSFPKSHPVAEGTAALVKKLGIDVYTVCGNGAALVKPKWGCDIRSGNVRVTTAKLLSGEEAKNASVEDIERVLDFAIKHNDEEAAAGECYKSHDRTKGLDGVLYLCPHCKKEFTLKTEKHSIFCTECGYKAELTEDYRFKDKEIGSVNEWYDLQNEELDLNIPLSDDIIVGAVNENGDMVMNAGEGRVTLTYDSLTLNCTVFGEEISYSIPTEKIGGTPYTPKREFDIYYNKRLLYLQPKSDKKRVVKYAMFVDKRVAEAKAFEV